MESKSYKDVNENQVSSDAHPLTGSQLQRRVVDAVTQGKLLLKEQVEWVTRESSD